MVGGQPRGARRGHVGRDYPLAGRVGTAAGEAYQAASDQRRELDFGLARIVDGLIAHLPDGSSRPPWVDADKMVDMDLDLTADAVTLTQQLVDIESVSHHEQEIADAVETALRSPAAPHGDPARPHGRRAHRARTGSGS